jgi:colanic acid/amylovoran biosynthesis glycosyltransferase
MIAFVVNQFPRQVDAYFLRELVGLAEEGVDFTLYSLLPAPSGWKIHEDARMLLGQTVYPAAPVRRLARGAGGLLRQPGKSLRLLSEIIRGHRTMPAALAKSLAILPQTIEFADEMKHRGVRHIHANWATYPATAALAISRLTGIPFSFSGHATDIFVHHAMLEEKLAAAKFVITCTGFNRGYLGDLCPAARDKIETVYHGVDLARFARNGAARDPDLILSVGTLRACKGFDDLIRAVALLKQRGRRARLEILGEGEERENLEALVRELGVSEQVLMPGYLPQEEIIPAYHRAAAVALPAHHEDHFGIPNILIEGLAASVPVVCTELPSLHELVEDGKSGLFIPERDPEALADAIERLLAAPDFAAEIAEEGRRRVADNFDMRVTVHQLAERFAEADRSGGVG